jgi:hypothetical protein
LRDNFFRALSVLIEPFILPSFPRRRVGYPTLARSTFDKLGSRLRENDDLLEGYLRLIKLWCSGGLETIFTAARVLPATSAQRQMGQRQTSALNRCENQSLGRLLDR